MIPRAVLRLSSPCSFFAVRADWGPRKRRPQWPRRSSSASPTPRRSGPIPIPPPPGIAPSASPAHTAWMMVAAALVLFMTLPGLVLFYGGLVRQKNVLSMAALCLGITALVSVIWWAFGYSLVFGKSFAAEGASPLARTLSPSWEEASSSSCTASAARPTQTMPSGFRRTSSASSSSPSPSSPPC